MKIYTKGGDKGETSLYRGVRLPKDNVRIEAYGTVDEANAAIGFAMACISQKEILAMLKDIQNDLFVIQAELADKTPEKHLMSKDRVEKLEKWIDTYQEQLPKLTNFTLPSGSQGGSALHLARTTVRRAERNIVSLKREEQIRDEPLIYMNRLSDLLYVLGRWVNKQDGAEENSPTY